MTNLDTSTPGLLKPTVTAAAMISQATGTAIGNFGENGGSLSLLFDGTTNAGVAGSAVTNSATSGKYFGKTYSGGQSVSKARVYGRNDAGYLNSGTGETVTIELCWKDGAAPNSTASDVTVAGSVSFTEVDTTNMQEITSNTTAPHDHWVLRFSRTGTANAMFAVEGEFYGLPTTNNLSVSSVAFTAATEPTRMKALFRVKEVDTAVAGTDYTFECSRDGGATYTTMALTELYTSASPTAGMRVVEAAETDVSGQPSGTSPRWRFKTLNNKMVELHDAYFYWD
ncbi:hypothetical protein [Devosia salina]|uniref:Uncharacterized protein n=1 Tax=Devosia salina TaxID=2860336 RepID=A0ABX8W8Y7_9HYPH|nr:hypothetical protein [Devosia salina]QYO75338.1 hypothetical protein K1X15_11830 [Devosia salina]